MTGAPIRLAPVLPPIELRDVYRYAGIRGAAPDAETEQRLLSLLPEAEAVLSPRAVYAVFPAWEREGVLSLGFAESKSESLRARLSGCTAVAVFAVTVGHGLDRLSLRYGYTAPASAHLVSAIGSERAEALADAVNRALVCAAERSGYTARPRFSVGYGDMALSLQADILRVLDAGRTLGLTLSDSYMMSPLKSVTALVGLQKNKPS